MTTCPIKQNAAAKGLTLGDLVAKPLNEIPDLYGILHGYMGVPTSGYDRPVFIGHGLADQLVPQPLALVASMRANGVPVTYKTYSGDHGGAFSQSQEDTVPFVAGLFK